MALLKLTAERDDVCAEEVWFQKQPMPAWHDGTIIVGDHVYAGTGKDVLVRRAGDG